MAAGGPTIAAPLFAGCGDRGRPIALGSPAPPGTALLLPRCRSVHTFGMRFDLDLIWLDQHGRVLAVDESVPPCRVRSRRDAAQVIEVAAGTLKSVLDALYALECS
jgi:uncharacterized protein